MRRGRWLAETGVPAAAAAAAIAAVAACGSPEARDHEEAPVIEHAYADVNGVRLHYAAAGHGEPILFLHGFPEFWYAWRDLLLEFGRDRRAVAPDLRGYNLSSKPAEVEAYAVSHLVEDVRALAGHLGHERFVLVGHDWGGVVAWAFAMAHPERLDGLVVINAPHPAVFQRELSENPAQQEASRYMLLFASPEAEEALAADDHAMLVEAVLAEGLEEGYFAAEDRDAYLEAWSRPGALTGGLNYYRASGIGPPEAGAGGQPEGGSGAPAGLPDLEVTVPTLVIWGERDPYLLTGNLEGLNRHVADLTVRRVPDAGHWIVHQRPELVIDAIREFLEGR